VNNYVDLPILGKRLLFAITLLTRSIQSILKLLDADQPTDHHYECHRIETSLLAAHPLASGEPSVGIDDTIATSVEAASQPGSEATVSMISVLSTAPSVSKQAEILLVSKLLNLYCLVNREHLYPVFPTTSHLSPSSKAFL